MFQKQATASSPLSPLSAVTSGGLDSDPPRAEKEDKSEIIYVLVDDELEVKGEQGYFGDLGFESNILEFLFNCCGILGFGLLDFHLVWDFFFKF